MAKNIYRVIVKLYSLVFTNRKNERYGRVLTARSVDEDGLIDIIMKRGTDLNRSTIRAVLDMLKGVAKEEIANGASVSFGLGYFDLLVNGVFLGDNPKWDPDKHSLHVRIKPSAELRNMLNEIKVEVSGMAQSGIFINLVTDVVSGEENSRLTPGGSVNISGVKIRVAGDSPDNGIRLTEQNSGTVVSIPMSTVAVNEPSKIIFIVPASLPAGDYKLSITTQFRRGTELLKEPRTYTLDYVLAV
jgi:hypothetical protein